MACKRSLSTSGTVIARRLHLSFVHIRCDDHDEASCCSLKRDCSSQSTSINSLPRASSGSRNLLGPQSMERWGFLFVPPPGISSSLCRYMSSASGDNSSLKIDDVIREASPEKVMDVVTSQSSPMSEVALAAADSSYPVAGIEYLIGAVHSFTGLNWWASIALTTVLIRGATAPLQINQMRSTAKLSLMRPRVEELNRTLRETASAPDAASKYLQSFTSLFKEYGISPFTPLKGILIRGPIFLSFFFAIRNMAEKIPSFKTGGTLWFVDLSTPDSLYILPILTALTFWIAVEFHLEEGVEGTAVAGTLKKFFRIFAVLSIPVMSCFPKAMFGYWLTTNLFSLAFGLGWSGGQELSNHGIFFFVAMTLCLFPLTAVVQQPGIKKLLKVPETPVSPASASQQFSQAPSSREKDEGNETKLR